MSSLWYPFTPMQEWAANQQLSIHRAEGTTLYDQDDRPYLDGVSSLWTTVHGHNHPVLNQAIIDQVGRVAHSTLLGLGNPKAEELADQLVKITPEGLSHVFFSDSGSSSVEIALKQAFQYWQLIGHPNKTRFVHLDCAYHGDTLGAVAVGGIGLFHETFGPLLLETLSIPTPHLYRHLTAKTAEEAKRHSIQALERLLTDRADEIAALIMEPLVQGAGGLIVHPPGFLAEVAALCRNHEVLLILDEVATGFGRTGKLFACEHEDVAPDLLCLAKGITGGYLPLAATLATDRIFDAFLAPRHEGKTFFHGHTYTGNPIACAVALANLQVFRDENTIASLDAKISHLQANLAALAEHPHVGDVRQRGLMVGIELVRDRRSKEAWPPEQAIGHKVCMEARHHGVIVRNLSDVIVLMPPLSTTEAEIDQLVDAIRASLEVVLA